MLRALALAAVLAASALPGQPSSALAAPDQPGRAFCDGAILRDYLAPLERLPKLNSPGPSSQLDFGPPSLRLEPLPSLLAGGGPIGYRIFTQSRASSLRLGWTVTTTLARVNWRGRSVEVHNQTRKRLATVSSKRETAIRFRVNDYPAPYRLTTVFRDELGDKLGAYGFYFRVVAPTQDVRLGLSASSYRSGDTVLGRIENFGSETVQHGAPYTIERLEGTAWVVAPETPDNFILPLYFVGPGEAGDECAGFSIPSTMPPGRYRMSEEISDGRPGRTLLTAEFDLLP